jgi:hypothetical protein
VVLDLGPRFQILAPVDGFDVPEPDPGQSFATVLVVVGAESAAALDSMDARAFTDGGSVAFGSGGFAPGGLPGTPLMAHEATHSVQVRAGLAVTVNVTDASGKVIGSRSVASRQGATQASGEPATGSLIGRVVEGGTQLPLVGVPVRIEETGERAYTDPDGIYRFPRVPAGQASIAIEQP